MTIEQLILLLLLVGIPVGRRFVQWMNSQGRATLADDHTPTAAPDRDADETEVPWPPPPRTAPPPRSSAAAARHPQHRRTVVPAATSTVASRPSVVLPPRVGRPAGNEATRAARALIQGGRHDLRQSVALMAILGPPRALDPPG